MSDAGETEPPAKRQATESVVVKTEPGAVGPVPGGSCPVAAVKSELEAAAPGLDTSGEINKQRVADLKKQIRGALVKRQKLLTDELNFLERGRGLLDYCQAVFKAGQSQGSALAGADVGKKADGLTDEEKNILAKAKAIELRHKQKSKWPEPPRRKVHHDYLLEEMTWLATDFRQERKWKMAVAKKVAYAVVKWHSQRQLRADRADKDKENKARKNAQKIAKEVKRFWSQIETLAQHKQQVHVDVEKKKLLGKHLDFLVDQTEKYSTMIAQDLAAPSVQLPSAIDRDEAKVQRTPSRGGRGGDGGDVDSSSAQGASDTGDPADGEFAVGEEEEDDEQTMEEAEKLDGDVKEEVDELTKEQDMPIEELLAKYGMVRGEAEDDDDDEDEDDEDEDEDEEDEDVEEEEEVKEESETSMMVDKDETVKDVKAEDKVIEALDGAEKKAVDGEIKGDVAAGEEEAGLSAEAKDVADSAAALKPTGHTLATTQVKTTVPFLLNPALKMREYQHIALDWMIALYDKGLNGILADEMGLGKTIMTISVLAHLACERGIWGPHLIVVPTSLLLNWEIEFKRWCPSFKVLTYYGTQKERKEKRQGWSKQNSFHVCITSYKMAVQDQKMFRRKKWKYMILDEAHNIKNFQSQRWQVLLGFRSKRRLLLTGTPLQNNLMELWSLLHFLMPHIFTSHSEFKDWFANPLMQMVEGSSAVNHTLVNRLHSVLRPFILRRLKKDVEKQMPDKYEHVVECPLSKRQRCLYDDFMAAGSTQSKLASGNLLEVINVLMQLRKVCNHPDLFEERPIVSPLDLAPSDVYNAGMVTSVGKWQACDQVNFKGLNFVLSELEEMSQLDAQYLNKSSPSKKLIVELTGSGLGVSGAQSGRGKWSSVAEYKAQLAARRQDMKADSMSALLSVNERRCSASPVFGADLCRLVRSIRSCTDQIIDMSLDPKKNFEHTDALRHLVLTAEERVYGRGGRLGNEELKRQHPMFDGEGREVYGYLTAMTQYTCIIPKARGVPPRVCLTHAALHSPDQLTISERTNPLFVRVTEIFSEFDDIVRPARIRQQLCFPDKRLLQYDCGKLQKLDSMLRELKKGSHRVLLFTQMSKVLDVVEEFLCFHGHTYVRLDGSTKIENRQKLVERFNQDPKIFVFISSTRAGGVGINLTGADTVIFYDSDWNPAMDRQAQDRCHRIGQTRDVHIYRLVSQHTVEENILKKARQKIQLENLALKEGASSLFNPEMFKKVDVRELFQDDVAAPEIRVNPLAHLMQDDKDAGSKEAKDAKVVKAAGSGKQDQLISDKEWELAIANAEDERDVEAMKNAKAEEKEELADFNEEEAGERGEGEGSDDYSGKVESVALAIESELTSVQRYALHFLEAEYEKAGISLVEGVQFDKEGWEKDQLRRIRDNDADRLIDEDEILYYEVSGCSQQVYRELVTRLHAGPDGSNLDCCFYEPPNPDDDKLTVINEPMYQQDPGMRGLAQQKKDNRAGPPKNNQLKIKFTMPQPGMPGGQGLKKQNIISQQQGKRRPISAWEVPWTKEEEDILKEAIDRFQQVSGNIPIKTWHLHASILNSSIAARGRNRMGKHLKEYWEGRLQPDTQSKSTAPVPYPERSQLSDPTRDANIAAIIRAKQMIPSQPVPGHNQKSSAGQKQRETVATVQVHESHRASLQQTLQQFGLQSISQVSPSQVLILKAKQAQVQSQSQIRQGHPNQAGHPGGAGRGGPPGAQQRIAHAGQVRQGVPGSAGQGVPGPARQGVPGSAGAGRGAVPGKAGTPGTAAPGQMPAGSPGQLGHMQAGRGQVPVAAAGRGMPQAAGRAQMPPHGMQQPQSQAAQAARAQQQQHHAIAASQMHAGARVPQPGHGHPQHHDQVASPHGQVPSPHAMQAGRGMPGGYVQPSMPPGAGQHVPGSMPMQHPGMPHPTQTMMQAQQAAASRQRAPKKAPASSPRNTPQGPPSGGAPPPKR